jgi:lipid-binding SYLF domain-containing protein
MSAFYRILPVVAALSMSATIPASAQDMATLTTRLNDASTVIKEIMQTPDKAVPNSIVAKATCIAVVPGVKKAAFVVGGSYGQGVVTCHKGNGAWSAPVFIRLAGGSFGFQIGAQSTDLVLVAVNDGGMQSLLKSKFKIGGDASAAAGPVGRNTSASTDILMKAELLTWSRSKGIFAGIDLNGVSISQNTDDTDLLYGTKDIHFDQVLNGGKPTPAAAKPFVAAITRYFHASK